MSIDTKALLIVEDALGIDDPAARAALVAERCGEDAPLRARVEELLRHDTEHLRLTPTTSFIRPLSVVEAIPERIGPYRVTGEIARGGMGAVVRAERDDGVFEKQVAIKLIRGDLASDRARARFAEERRMLARLTHPGIVRIIDGGEVDNRPWLAMDYVDGLPVTQALDGAAQETRLDAFETVCEAVAHAHRNLIVHADIKPSNVLMSADSAVHLLDFGIARLIVGLDGDEVGDPYPLTKGYAAPERGVGLAPTIASDVFSLGVLLLEMLGKRAPESDMAMVAGTRLPVGELEGDLAAIAAKALAEKPEDRYPDVAALLSDLRRHRAFVPVAARGDAGWGYVAGRFVRRHRRGLALSALAATLLTATSVVSTISYVRAERARAEADARFVELRALAQFMLTELSDRMSDAPGTLPARARLAEVAGNYLEQLSAVRDAPLDLRLDTARGYLRLASLQGLTGAANLGRPAEAAVSLDRAQAILSGLDRDAAGVSAALGDLALARWVLAASDEGPALTRQAEEHFRRALARDQGDMAALLGSLIVRKNQGFELIWADRPGEALPVLRSALTDLRAASWPAAMQRDARLLEVGLLARIGDAIYYGGDVPGALVPYQESAALIRAEIARAPSLMWQEKLGEAVWNVSSTLGELGRDAEGLAEAERGIADLQRTLSFGPDAAIEARLFVLYGQQSLLLEALGRTGEAAEASTISIALRQQRLRLAPADTSRQRDLAVALAAHADILAAAGRRGEACAAARQGVALMAGLEDRGALAAYDLRSEVPKLDSARDRHCN